MLLPLTYTPCLSFQGLTISQYIPDGTQCVAQSRLALNFQSSCLRYHWCFLARVNYGFKKKKPEEFPGWQEVNYSQHEHWKLFSAPDCSSLFSVAVINMMTRSNLGRKGLSSLCYQVTTPHWGGQSRNWSTNQESWCIFFLFQSLSVSLSFLPIYLYLSL